MTAQEYVDYLHDRFGVPRAVAVEAERRCRETLGLSPEAKEMQSREIARMCALAAAKARVS